MGARQMLVEKEGCRQAPDVGGGTERTGSRVWGLVGVSHEGGRSPAGPAGPGRASEGLGLWTPASCHRHSWEGC